LPTSTTYKLLTTGKLSKDDDTFPESKHGVEWSPTLQPMQSAYSMHDGKEPDFTNYSKVKDGETFVETIDYIFLSPHWKTLGVKPLKHRDSVKDGPYPNACEPSDHVMIAATLQL